MAHRRPRGVTALGVFFAIGAVISGLSCVSLSLPGSPLEPMWRLNPRAREAFSHMGGAGPLLLAVVSVACAFAAVGLWSGRTWGHRLAMCLLLINLAGDVTNVILGIEPRAAVGIPIVLALLVFLSTARVRSYFRQG